MTCPPIPFVVDNGVDVVTDAGGPDVVAGASVTNAAVTGASVTTGASRPVPSFCKPRRPIYVNLNTTPDTCPVKEKLRLGYGTIEYGKSYALLKGSNAHVTVIGRIQHMLIVIDPSVISSYPMLIPWDYIIIKGSHLIQPKAKYCKQLVKAIHHSTKRKTPSATPLATPPATSSQKKKPKKHVSPSAPAAPAPTVSAPVAPAAPASSAPQIMLSNESGVVVPLPSGTCLGEWSVWTDRSWTRFEPTLNDLIEKYFLEHVSSVGYWFSCYQYILDFSTMKQVNVTTNMKRDVRRVDKSKSTKQTPPTVVKPPSTADSTRVKKMVELLASSQPSYWKSDQIELAFSTPDGYALIPCTQGDTEYIMVSGMLAGVRKLSIVDVFKIVNPVQYSRYVHWCDTLRLQHPSLDCNEQYVFHGTPESATKSIAKEGFKYRYNGRHLYGRGNYFAVSPAYSVDEEFASANAKGHRHLFVVRACLGMLTQGVADLMPSTNGSYHTAVDNLRKPSMYITFHDDQTCPEFLVVLKK